MPFDRNLDPTSEYTSLGFALFSNLLLRPLMNYRHVAGERGIEVVPDLAAEMPDISDDGLTYEFTIRDGVRFGPPLDRDVTAYDVAYAFERLATPEAGARYGFYFSSAIVGMTEFSEGTSDSISGIETPDQDTIIFHLRQPTGDFMKRVAMPAAAPLPEEIAGCFDGPAGYGRHLVATGPYMLQGSEHIGTDCTELEPARGFVPERRLTLVRNPNYDRATDDPSIRSARFARYEMTVEEDSDEIYRRIEAGKVDITSGGPGLDEIRRYTSRRSLRDNLHVESGDRIWYMSMNLTEPPFDDINVRRAANHIMDKDFLVRTWGGDILGEVATHILPDDMLGGALESFDPYASRNHAGDVAAARRAMAKSSYDRDADGICDAAACKDVLHVTRSSPPWPAMSGIIGSSFAKIGIALETRAEHDAYSVIQKLPNNVPITSAPGWVKDYPDPFSFIGFLFDGRNIRRPANTNYAMVGLTREHAAELDIDAPARPVPSVDAAIDRCVATLDDQARTDCWADLDRMLMTEVVPWIPYLDANKLIVTSDAVTPYEFDQFSGEISFAHIGIDRSF
ncbi:MAG: hypothetical protein KY391_00540 [Actinobacteria bacterium]|nr:hypothetical protein [Actinomycetota bacterium]